MTVNSYTMNADVGVKTAGLDTTVVWFYLDNFYSTVVVKLHSDLRLHGLNLLVRGWSICMTSNTNTHTHTHTYIHIHTQTHTQTHTHIYTQTHTHKHTHIHTQTHTHVTSQSGPTFIYQPDVLIVWNWSP